MAYIKYTGYPSQLLAPLHQRYDTHLEANGAFNLNSEVRMSVFQDINTNQNTPQDFLRRKSEKAHEFWPQNPTWLPST